MSDQETKTPEISRTRTILWLGVGILVYVFIQWMMPKVGLNS